jgi:hypothetical protein
MQATTWEGKQLTASHCVDRARRLRRLARGANGDGDLPPGVDEGSASPALVYLV